MFPCEFSEIFMNTTFYRRLPVAIEAALQRCYYKVYSENMQQIHRTSMLKYNFNKLAWQLYWNHTSAWMFSCKFAAYFRETFSKRIPPEGWFRSYFWFELISARTKRFLVFSERFKMRILVCNGLRGLGTGVVVWRCSVKKFLKISEKSE